MCASSRRECWRWNRDGRYLRHTSSTRPCLGNRVGNFATTRAVMISWGVQVTDRESIEAVNGHATNEVARFGSLL
jgi:hypothetical protein